MNTAERLARLKKDIDDAFNTGYPAGEKAAYDLYWDAIQNNGKREMYRNFFIDESWNNNTFKPKYDLRVSNAEGMFHNSKISGDFVELLENLGIVLDTSNCGQMTQMFGNCSEITRLGVLDFSKTGRYYSQQTFMFCTKLKTIDKIIFSSTEPKQSFYLAFQNCTALENITVEGVITPDDLTFQWCPLTAESMQSVISHLKNFSGTDEEYKHNIVFSSQCWKNLNDKIKPPLYDTWQEYVEYELCWNT